MSSVERETAMRTAIREAHARAVEWELPDLVGVDARAEVVGLLVRDRALVIVERDLVDVGAARRRRSPFSSQWAVQWWYGTALPAARERVDAAWWMRRAPREALSWAIALDPEAAGEAGYR